MPYTDEPNEAEKIAVRIEGFGNSHTLYPLAAALREKIAIVRERIETYNVAIRAGKSLEAELEIAKEALIRQYEYNYLDARRTLGTVSAEKLFPLLSSRAKDENGADTTTTGTAATK
jgi:hypothetical protein